MTKQMQIVKSDDLNRINPNTFAPDVIEKISENLLCDNCEMIPTITYFCKRCKISLCKTCTLSSKKGEVCPTCSSVLPVDKELNKKIYQMHLKKGIIKDCCFKTFGCQMTLNYTEIREHEKRCNYQILKCSYCLKSIHCDEITNHLKNCEQRKQQKIPIAKCKASSHKKKRIKPNFPQIQPPPIKKKKQQTKYDIESLQQTIQKQQKDFKTLNKKVTHLEMKIQSLENDSKLQNKIKTLENHLKNVEQKITDQEKKQKSENNNKQEFHIPKLKKDPLIKKRLHTPPQKSLQPEVIELESAKESSQYENISFYTSDIKGFLTKFEGMNIFSKKNIHVKGAWIKSISSGYITFSECDMKFFTPSFRLIRYFYSAHNSPIVEVLEKDPEILFSFEKSQKMKIWNLSNQNLEDELCIDCRSDISACTLYTRDENVIVANSKGDLWKYDVKTQDILYTVNCDNEINNIVEIADGRIVASVLNQKLLIVDYYRETTYDEIPIKVENTPLSHTLCPINDYELSIAANHAIHIVDLRKNSFVKTINAQQNSILSSAIFKGENNYLISGGMAPEILVYDLTKSSNFLVVPVDNAIFSIVENKNV